MIITPSVAKSAMASRLDSRCHAMQTGNWADVSGETFLRELLMMGPQEARPNNVSNLTPSFKPVVSGWLKC